MKKRVEDLEKHVLDYWVAKADGERPVYQGFGNSTYVLVNRETTGGSALYAYSPSSQWNYCGELITKHNIALENTWRPIGSKSERWFAGIISHYDSEGIGIWKFESHGATPQEAICRCVIKSKFGDKIDVE